MRYSSPKPCPIANICGGCIYSAIPYELELEKKEDEVIRKIGRYGYVFPIIGTKKEHYRDKVQAVFGKNRKGEIISGLYCRSSHHIVSVKNCQLEFEEASAILRTIRKMSKSLSISPYDEDLKKGMLRHVLLRKGHNSNEIMVILIFGTPAVNKAKELANAIKEAHKEVNTILFQVNGEETSMVLSDGQMKVLYGKGYIKDTISSLSFTILPSSFYQINSTGTETLYKVALKMAGLSGRERVIDAYSGTGTIALLAAREAREVLSIEINPDAIKSGKKSAEENGIENVIFIEGDASEKLKEMSKNKEKADVVFLDPPRRGSDERFLSSVMKLSPESIVYISCGLDSLERDLRYMTKERKYFVQAIQPVDMFPRTEHVETVVLLSKQ